MREREAYRQSKLHLADAFYQAWPDLGGEGGAEPWQSLLPYQSDHPPQTAMQLYFLYLGQLSLAEECVPVQRGHVSAQLPLQGGVISP